MGWKATGTTTVRKQRGKWVVRVDGIDTETGRRRPRQLGTYESKRSALMAARMPAAEDRAATRSSVGWLVREYVAGRTDLTPKAKEQYEWAIPHIDAGLGALRLDRLERSDVAAWLEHLASSGRLSWRSIQICRTVLLAALSYAVDEGLLRRNPGARVPMPRTVTKPPIEKEAAFWTAEEVDTFLDAVVGHRFAVPLRLGVLYGLRRSEALALRWDDLDARSNSLRIDEGIIALRRGIAWSDGKNRRSRRTIPLDPATVDAFNRRRRQQAEERLAAGPAWNDLGLVTTIRDGGVVLPRSYDRALALIITKAGLPRLSTHGLRHTAATHMVAGAANLNELRAVADVLGHSPDMLMKVYAHALPESRRSIADRIGARRPT